jgi:CheY-like chemotaxis protein
MTTPATAHRGRVLFLDDEAPFLRMIAAAATQWSQGQWEVHTAESAGAALAVLQRQPADLVAVDVLMPVVDGVQFLGLLQRRFPGVQKVVLTAYVDDTQRTACLAAGAELFLEKPRTQAGLERVFATINELLRWPASEGFHGVMRRVGLQDVLQMECLARNSAILEVAAQGQGGTIHIRDGQIVDARAGSLSGEEAFNHLLALRGGGFGLKPFEPPAQETIAAPYEFLLIEAVRLRDEKAAQAEPPAGHDAGIMAADDPAARGALLPPSVPAPASPAPMELPLEPASQAPPLPFPATATAAQITTRAQPGGRIEELLICSAQGEVLHQWQCADPDGRVRLLEFVSKKARQLALGLPAGDFDRLELRAARGRVVLLVQSDRGALVRIGPGGAPQTPPLRLSLPLEP